MRPTVNRLSGGGGSQPRRPRARGVRWVVSSSVVAALSFGLMIGLGLYGTAERSAFQEVVGSEQREGSVPHADPHEETDGLIGTAVDDAREDGSQASRGGGIVLVRFAVIFGIPLASLVFALAARSRPAAIAARGIATFVLAGLTLLTFFSAGFGFAIATLLMAAATLLAMTEPTGSRA